jgi:hypothetical protein
MKKDMDLLKEFSKEKAVYELLYGNLIIDDFLPMIKYDILNMNVENYVFNDLSFENIIEIVGDDILKNIDSNNENFLNVASAAGKITIITAMLYNFSNNFGVDNIYEMNLLSRNLLDKAVLDTSEITKEFATKKIIFFLKDPLLIEFGEYKLIIFDYNNNNRVFNAFLQEKVEREVQKGAIIVKIFDNFEESKHLKLLKTKILRNEIYKKNFMVFYYEKR